MKPGPESPVQVRKPSAGGARRWTLDLGLGTAFLFAFLSSSSVAEIAPPTNSALGTALTDLARTTKRIPFREVIQATTHRRVLDFDTNNPAHVGLRQQMLLAARLAGERARREGLSAARANEAGNQMEAIAKAALRDVGLNPRTPVNAAGVAQSAGYPDLEIAGPVPCYLELKTYSAPTARSTQRSFYFSPSSTPKVTRDALHLLLAFELEKVERGGQLVFVPTQWKLLTLQDLPVDLKLEFNQSNRGLYGHPQGVLEQGGVLDTNAIPAPRGDAATGRSPSQ